MKKVLPYLSNEIKSAKSKGVWGHYDIPIFSVSTMHEFNQLVGNVVYFDGMQLFTASGQFNLAPGGMESKQFGFDLAETRQFGNMVGQNTIVSAKIPTNMLNQFYTGGVDTSIFRSGTLTVYGDQLAAFNQAVGGTIKFMP